VGGNQIGANEQLTNVPLSNGVFTVTLNGSNEFGPAPFNGQARFLQVEVCSDATCTARTTLGPRQPLTAAPFAAFAPAPWLQPTPGGANIAYTAGNVGINTQSPANRLHVAAASVGDGVRVSGGVGADPGFLLYNGSTQGGALGLAASATSWSLSAAAGDLVLRSNTNRNLILQSGMGGSGLLLNGLNQVGVGTTSPLAQFDTHTTGTLAILGETTATTGSTIGVNGSSLSIAGTGVFGFAAATTGSTVGVYGQANSTTGDGVHGLANSTSGGPNGVFGQCNAPNGNGVTGLLNATTGIGNGVEGISHSGDSLSDGVYCVGNFDCTGNKSFRIDHPDDPQNMYLKHYCSEGPEPLNVYQGRVRTDAAGYAWITLPHYFAEINRSPQYNLTVIDASDDFVLAKVSHEIENNQFQIRTSKPGVDVCWEVKAVRNDLWVQRFGAPVEIAKPDSQRGTYQNPELYGRPPEMGMDSIRSLSPDVTGPSSRP
jgi:hypothetical protein